MPSEIERLEAEIAHLRELVPIAEKLRRVGIHSDSMEYVVAVSEFDDEFTAWQSKLTTPPSAAEN